MHHKIVSVFHSFIIFSYENGSPIPREFFQHPIPFQGSAVKELLPTGFEEHDGLGRRFRDRMLKYFKLTDENVRFYSSSVDRSIASGRAFYNGVSSSPSLIFALIIKV
ncbi:unnamed protein product [Trichobilharzia regenti]|nr:unnamed protein product [Trichobilharzia regenti]